MRRHARRSPTPWRSVFSVSSAPRPVATPSGLLKPGADRTSPTDPSAYRKFRLTTYHVVDQRELPMGAVHVPIYADNGRKIAEGSPAFFAQLSLEGNARLRDGLLINVTGKTVPASHDEYAEVLAYHPTPAFGTNPRSTARAGGRRPSSLPARRAGRSAPRSKGRRAWRAAGHREVADGIQ